MSESDAADSQQSRGHQAEVNAFLALPLHERYRAMAAGPNAIGHIVDEVVVTAARRAHREQWADERHYSQQLVQRVYRHVRGHVSKNPNWQRRGGGFDTTADDCAAFVLAKLAAERGDVCHAENAFGDFVYKRSLDFADELFAQKRLALEPEDAETEPRGGDADLSAHASVLDELIDRELEIEDDAKLQQIRDLAQEEGLLTEKEQAAFVYYWFGGVPKLIICKLMNRKERSIRLYISSAIAKIKEKLNDAPSQ